MTEVIAGSKQDYQKKLDSLTKINMLLDRKKRADQDMSLVLTQEEEYDVDTFILSNIKKTFMSIQNALNYHTLDQDHRSPLQKIERLTKVQNYLELYIEALKLSETLLTRLDESHEHDLIDIHFQKVVQDLLFLYMEVEVPGEDPSSLNQVKREQSLRVISDIENLLRRYVKITGNIDQIIQVIHIQGVDNADPNLRFKFIQSIPELVIKNYLRYTSGRAKSDQIAGREQVTRLSKINSFTKLMEKLLLRAKGDRTDSIRIEAQMTLRSIVGSMKTQNSTELQYILENLSRNQVLHLKQYVDLEDKLNEIQREMDPVLYSQEPSQIYTWSRNMAFGAIPSDIVDQIRSNNDDWVIKLRCIEDLDHVLEGLSDPDNYHDLNQLRHYASSFVQFFQEYLLQDDHMDIKILFTAIKGIKLIVNRQYEGDAIQSKIVQARVNLKRLVNALIGKLNDPKEVVRNEVERLLVDLSNHMIAQDLVLQQLQVFETKRLNEFGRRANLQLVMIILLKSNHEEETGMFPRMWGEGEPIRQSQDLKKRANLKRGPDDDLYPQSGDQNLYLRLVEPISYLFQSKEQQPLVRYYAQEALAVMCLGCKFLEKSLVMEALYESLLGIQNQGAIYGRFCDRLEAKKIPYLVYLEQEMQSIYKLEMPLPKAYIFTVEGKEQINEQLQTLRQSTETKDSNGQYNNRQIPNFTGFDDQRDGIDYDIEYLGGRIGVGQLDANKSFNQAESESQGYVKKPSFVSLRERALRSKEVNMNRHYSQMSTDSGQTSGYPDNQYRFNGQKANRTNNPLRTSFSQNQINADSFQEDPYHLDQSRIGSGLPPINERSPATSNTPGKLLSLKQRSLRAANRKNESIQELIEKRQQEKTQIQNLNRSLQEDHQIDHYQDKQNLKMPKKGRDPQRAVSLRGSTNGPPPLAPNKENTTPVSKPKKHTYLKSKRDNDSRMQAVEQDDDQPGLQSTPQKDGGPKASRSILDANSAEKELYLSEFGPNSFEPLEEVVKELKQSIKDLSEEKDWKKQFRACNTIRRALRFHVNQISRTQVRSIIEKLLKLLDTLRSQVAKNSLLTLTDCFYYLRNGQIADAEIVLAFKHLLRKNSETNQFLALEARECLNKLCEATPATKTIQFLHPFYEEKAVATRKQVSHSLHAIMAQVGGYGLFRLPEATLKQLFTMLLFFLQDANQDVRANAKQAILTLEHGDEPLSGRTESLELISITITNTFDQQKLIEVLEKGPTEDRLQAIQSMTKFGGVSTYSSGSKAKQGRIAGNDDSFYQKSQSSASKIGMKNPESQNASTQGVSLRAKRAVLKQTNDESQLDEDMAYVPRKREIAPRTQSHSKLKTSLNAQREERHQKLLDISHRLYPDAEAKKASMNELLLMCQKSKLTVIKDPALAAAIRSQIILPLQNLRQQQEQEIEAQKKFKTRRLEKTREDQGPNLALLTQTFIEGEILTHLLPDFVLTHSINEPQEMTLVLQALVSYQNIQVKNQNAQKNAESCLRSIIESQHVNLTMQGVFASLKSAQARGKIILNKLLLEQVDNIFELGDQQTIRNFIGTLVYLMDEYKKAQGKSVSIDYKHSIRDIIKHTYQTNGPYLAETVPSSILPVLFEILNDGHKVTKEQRQQIEMRR